MGEMDAYRTAVMRLQVGHPHRSKCCPMVLPRVKTSTSHSPLEILVPPGLFSLVGVCDHPAIPAPLCVDGTVLHLQGGEIPGFQSNAPNAFSSPPERRRFKMQKG